MKAEEYLKEKMKRLRKEKTVLEKVSFPKKNDKRTLQEFLQDSKTNFDSYDLESSLFDFKLIGVMALFMVVTVSFFYQVYDDIYKQTELYILSGIIADVIWMSFMAAPLLLFRLFVYRNKVVVRKEEVDDILSIVSSKETLDEVITYKEYIHFVKTYRKWKRKLKKAIERK